MADENTIDRLQIEIDATAKNSSKGLDKLVNSLNNLKNSLGSNLSGLSTLATSLSALNSSASGLKSASSGMNALSNSAKKLVGVDFSMLAEQFGRLSRATKSVGDMSQQAGYLKEFANSINSFRRGMEKIQAARLEGLSTKIKQLVTAIRPLTNEMIRAGAGMSNFGEQMKYLAQASNTALRVQNKLKQTSATVKNNPFFGGGFKLVNFAAAIYMVRRLGSAIAGTIKNINSYVENMNLFSVAMGKYAESGQEFANTMQSKLGVDAGEVMRNMGLFMQLSTSFGIAGEQANVLSKNLTQLGYDIASFFNISVEESFTKLTSGIAGEIEPLRRIGIDISQARLEMELFNLGIKANVSDLSQADKSMLRYIAIMKQTVNVQGDMGRTIMTPANALRVLEAQIQIAGRAIGSIFIPALLQILPIAIAVVRVIGDLARAFASFLGFEMPVIDYSSLNVGLGATTDGLEDVTDGANSAKKAVSALIGGFDELNVLNKDTGSSKDGGLGNLLGGIKLPEYDMLTGLVQTDIDGRVEKIKKSLGGIADVLKPSTKSLQNLTKELDKLKNFTASGLSALYSNILVPLETWTSNELLPAFIDLLAGSLSTLNSTLIVIQPYLSAFVDKFLKPIASWTGGIIIKVLGTLSDILYYIGDWIKENPQKVISVIAGISGALAGLALITFISNLTTAIGSLGLLGKAFAFLTTPTGIAVLAIGAIVTAVVYLWQTNEEFRNVFIKIWDNIKTAFTSTADMFKKVWDNVLKPVFNTLFDNIAWLWDKHLAPLLKNIEHFVADLIKNTLKIYNEVILPIISWVVEVLGPPLASIFSYIIDTLGIMLAVVIDVSSGFITAFRGIITFLTGVFVGDWRLAWEGIREVFRGIIESISGIFKGVINTIIGSLNYLIRKVNKISIDVPDTPLSDGFKIGFSIPEIPKLADGGVLYDNTVVRVGEYANASNNPEIVTPQNIMYDTVAEATAEGFIGIIEELRQLRAEVKEKKLDVNLDGEKISNNTIRNVNNITKATGECPIIL